MSKLFLSEKIKGDEAEKQRFTDKLLNYADLLKTNPDWLMLVMFFESGLNPAAVNSSSGATGLIQFTRPTANYLGTSVDELKQMSGSDQLDFVYKYLKSYKGKLGTLTDVYLTVFYPYAVGKPDSYILGSHLSQEITENITKQNKIFDTNQDNQISKAEVTNYFTNWAKRQGYTGDVKETPQKKKSKQIFLLGLLIGSALYLVTKKF